MTGSSQKVAAWLFGRGCSIATDLRWAEPRWWKVLPRQIRIALIRMRILRDMEKVPRRVGPYRNLLLLLSTRTHSDWQHQFNTTNWDYLLQREINDLALAGKPKWLLNSHVFHLNGSVENWGDPTRRAEILLETDPADYRSWSLEASKAFNVLVHQQLIIVAGISFRCETDRTLLNALACVEDDLAIGEATWIVLNSNLDELNNLKVLIAKKFPRGRIIPVHQGFGEWVSTGCVHLKGQCVIQ
jgi:hypothetical protein